MNNALNNALNLFPTTQTPQNAQNKLRTLVYNATSNARGPTEIQSTLARSLYDDAVEYMTTLEMNRAASYTFGYHNSYGQNGTTLNELGGGTHGESVASEMWELVIDWTLEEYMQHSVLALTKTIHLIQHVLTHGSESCVMNGELLYKIEMALVPLRNLNTALVEQRMVEQILNNEGRASGLDNDIVLTAEGIGQQLSQFGTRATATMLKLRGGSVDKGHPVRVAANNLYHIVSIPNNLRQMRMKQQQQLQQQPGGSLVPIGSTKEVGYITDEGRHRLLQQKIAAEEKVLKQKQRQEQQKLNHTRSNLAGASALDSFGGGYASSSGSGGKIVVGAANSLEDMIQSAKYELDQHKAKHAQKISSLKKGYSDDPYTRAQQLEELERSSAEMDPEFVKKEKALKDALEYLEEMQREQQEQVGNLLEGDLLGDASSGSGSGAGNLSGSSGAMMTGGESAAADLLGFDNNPSSPVDVFGGASMPMTSNVSSGGGSADLLGFDSLGGGDAFSSQPTPAMSTMPGYMMGTNSSNLESNVNQGPVGGEMRPSLVTGIGGTASMGGPSFQQQQQQQQQQRHQNPPAVNSSYSDNTPATGAPMSSTLQPELDEEARAENSRKMQMAAGLFAGVVPNNDTSKSSTGQQKRPIMQSGNSSNVSSALDDLIPLSDATGAPPTMSEVSTNNSSVFDSDLGSPSMPPSSDPFGMGPMGTGSLAPPPSMAPPPPPTEPPPPPPPPNTTPAAMVPPNMAPNNNNNNLLGNNPSVEQMQEMIKQQQAQMNQMMQMMQQMQMQGGSSTNGNGAMGWPPSS